MHESNDATRHTWKCDMPGCLSRADTYANDLVTGYLPPDWRAVAYDDRLVNPGPDDDLLLLCSRHTSDIPLVRLILKMIDDRQRIASRDSKKMARK